MKWKWYNWVQLVVDVATFIVNIFKKKDNDEKQDADANTSATTNA